MLWAAKHMMDAAAAAAHKKPTAMAEHCRVEERI
jgi:hypothetical protein